MKDERKANTFHDNRVNMVKNTYMNNIMNKYQTSVNIQDAKEMTPIYATNPLIPPGIVNDPLVGYTLNKK